MSAEAVGWVWKHSPYKGVGLVLHLAVADIANDIHDNRIWINPITLGEKAGTPRETASRWLWKAVEDGLLEVVDDRRKVRDGRGYRTVSEFRFLMTSEGRNQAAPCDETSHDRPAPCDETPQSLVTTHHAPCDDRSQLTSRETTQEKNTNPRRSSQGGLDEDFEAWYAAFPRKREKANGLKAYRARRRQGVSAADLLAAAEAYAKDGRKTGRPLDKTKYPASFLNNGWDDWLPGGAAATEVPSNGKPAPRTIVHTTPGGFRYRLAT